jgi:hypothetical protein
MPSTRHRWDPVCSPPSRLYRPRRIDPTGRTGPTPGQARGPRWRKTSHGYYVPVEAERVVPEQRILEESVRLPADGAVTGWAACRLLSATFFDGLEPDGLTERPVQLIVGPSRGRRSADGVTFLQDRLPAPEVVTRLGIACSTALRALFDEMRLTGDEREATVAMDMMAAAELASINQMERYVEAHGGWRGVETVRRALRLASENSRSPNETRMRLIWEIDAGLPRPMVNQPVFTLDGRLIGYADLFDEEAGLFGEYDGADHRWAARQTRDVAREDGCRRLGLEYFKVTGLDVVDRPRVVDRMHCTRARALFLPSTKRQWTLAPPPGWFDQSPEDAMTLDQRLAFRAGLHGLGA